MKTFRWQQWAIIVAGAALFCISIFVLSERPKPPASRPWKLYWFVPDGLRAEPDVFKLFQWAEEGRLPNIRRMMREGSYGYSIPVFPSHTPVNFATLFTGVYPKRHGVADGPIRIHDYPLKMVPRSGFSSVAKILDPFWFTLEQAGWMVTLLSVPGSTPPELTRGTVVKGRWGGWGMEFPNMNFHAHEDDAFRKLLGWNDRVFQMEKKLTEFVKSKSPEGWGLTLPQSFSPLKEVSLRNWDADLFLLLVDSRDDGIEAYDVAYVSRDKRGFDAVLRPGEWSDWLPMTLSYRTHRNYQDAAPQRLRVEQGLSALSFSTQARVRIIRLGRPSELRVRVLYDGLNDSVAIPHGISEDLHRAAGPMVDFVDNFPPQLIYFPEDKDAFLDEFEMSFAWHKRAQAHFFADAQQDVFIQSIYSPNQMFTSRWWLGHLDPKGRQYATTAPDERERLWAEMFQLYRHIDDMIGEALDRRGPDAYVILSSDHGAVPLNAEVRLNNLFARKGWLRYRVSADDPVPRVDWERTQVVFLNMNHVFINPDGLGGNYRPASGSAYERLRQEVIVALRELKDENGLHPLEAFHLREDAEKWGLPGERVGDLVIANRTGYGWIEDVTEDLGVFVPALKTGYKQAVLPEAERGLWTPFLIVGPGVKRGHRLREPITHVHQYPTVMKLLGVRGPHTADAEPLSEILEEGK